VVRITFRRCICLLVQCSAGAEAKAHWAEHKLAYLARLAHTNDYGALLVAASGKLRNTRTILADLCINEREGQPQEEFWLRLVADKPVTDLKRRMPKMLRYY
jgi:hypothetical protein